MINGVAVVARTGLKMTSLVQAGTVAAPEGAVAASTEGPEGTTAAAPIDAAHIDDLVSDSDEFASLPSVTGNNNGMTPMGAL